MSRAARTLAFFLGVCAAVAAVCAVAGALFVAFGGSATAAHAIAWAMWIGGALLILLVGQSGSTTRMAGESRIVVGGRFVRGSDLPQPTSPLFLIPAGAVVIALGVLVWLL